MKSQTHCIAASMRCTYARLDYRSSGNVWRCCLLPKLSSHDIAAWSRKTQTKNAIFYCCDHHVLPWDRHYATPAYHHHFAKFIESWHLRSWEEGRKNKPALVPGLFSAGLSIVRLFNFHLTWPMKEHHLSITWFLQIWLISQVWSWRPICCDSYTSSHYISRKNVKSPAGRSIEYISIIVNTKSSSSCFERQVKWSNVNWMIASIWSCRQTLNMTK